MCNALMRPTRRTALGMGLALAAPAPAFSAAFAAAPRRIVSVNPCLDTMLAHLADRSQIAALSHYARQESQSTIADFARDVPYTYENAEEIVALAPDLVLASAHSGRETQRALARLGVQVLVFPPPSTIDESLSQIRDLARAIGQAPRGDVLVASIEATIAQAARPAQARRPIRALVFQPRGLVAGPQTLVGEMMQRTGFENVAGRYGVTSWGNLPLEPLLADPPELLLSAQPDGAGGWPARLARHPALASIKDRMRRAIFPEPCLYCGGPVLQITAQALAKARDDYWGRA